ncbi:MAG: FGGY-family carbohydrate kinase, partial [Opitutae bacterium]
RAALESIALQVADVTKAMQDDARTTLRELRVDGGASVNNSLMQLQSDLLDVPIVRPSQTESTALGAACLAGLGVGIWESAEQISKVWQADA